MGRKSITDENDSQKIVVAERIYVPTELWYFLREKEEVRTTPTAIWV